MTPRQHAELTLFLSQRIAEVAATTAEPRSSRLMELAAGVGGMEGDDLETLFADLAVWQDAELPTADIADLLDKRAPLMKPRPNGAG